MTNSTNNGKQRVPRLSVFQFLSIVLISFGGFLAIGPTIGLAVAGLFSDYSFMELARALGGATETQGAKIPTLIVQGTATLIGFIVIPLILLKLMIGYPVNRLFNKLPDVQIFGLTVFITLCFMVVISPIVEWNEEIKMPEIFSSFEDWAKSYEVKLKELTEYLTTFDSPGEFWLGLMVIAVLPAIGEELVFRGIVQNQLRQSLNNAHLAIWISAFLFSAFHLQFYGIIPRMLLGGLFGYLYLWSGNLIVPLLAHFINNGFTLILLYLYQLDVSNFDVESPESIPLFPVIFSIIIGGYLIYSFRNYYVKEPTNE